MNQINRHLVILLVLLLISGFLFVVDGLESNSSSLDKRMFSVSLDKSFDRIQISSKKRKIFINQTKEGWLIDQGNPVDTTLIGLVQTIMNQVEVARPVSALNYPDIKRDLLSSGREVSIGFEDGTSLEFYAGGDASKRTAYFGTKALDAIYIVAIPGYKSYASGIFELTPGQWRDRVLFSSSWRTLQRWLVTYSDQSKEPLEIFFDEKFLSVRSILNLDTAAMMNYIQPLERFQVNDYLEIGAFPRYDSLAKEAPMATISVEDIDGTKNSTLQVYPKIAGEQFYLLTNSAGEMIVIDARRMDEILVNAEEFNRSKS
jgi:hypothetical protein